MTPADLLPPDQAFQFTSKVSNEKNTEKLLLSWDIAGGYYLYRHKFKFVSLTPGIKLEEASFPESHTKFDPNFGKVDIYQNHLEIEIGLQREDSEIDQLILGVCRTLNDY